MPRPAKSSSVPLLPDAWSPAARRALVKADPVMGALMKKVGPLRLELTPLHSPFEALARAIVYQQLHARAASTIFGRVCERVGHGKAFTPAKVLATPETALREAGLSANKLAALLDLARKTEDGTVPPLARVRRMPDADLVDHFTQVRGIGPWTVEMLLIFRLGRPDVLPVDDYGVRKGFMLAYQQDEMPRPKALLEFGERWRPWRTVASWYLWRATELPPESFK
ncbi:DNA-3-methyladenine glycosylase 2 family protein [Corallococcus sp. H22C18031201]|uniref:DNA-3-methyladenine glycosylase family protein n=1 Tax=Citreicoccus inhibens TaxID=2849499 RepID=UPI000E70CAD9|nr:DNA-3-methyladenine glycosylase [Citreicoccus inhibens]MBU8894222.1 DNA-3-methyladenine glycosylase [Citreicoccus inhibens]RJS23082.1 DNA-3-methyladenine glycosylase 2 family protein [Corallococcus sp. H22C18031201]